MQGRCPAFEGLRKAFSKSSLNLFSYRSDFRINPAINALIADLYNARYLLRT